MRLKKMLSEVICTFDKYIHIDDRADMYIMSKVGDTITMNEDMVAIMEMLESEVSTTNENVCPSGSILDFDSYIAEKRTRRKHVSIQPVDDFEEDLEDEE